MPGTPARRNGDQQTRGKPKSECASDAIVSLKEPPEQLLAADALCLEHLGFREAFLGESPRLRAVAPPPLLFEFQLTADEVLHTLLQIGDLQCALLQLRREVDRDAHPPVF